MLRRHQQREDLGHGGGADHGLKALFRQDGVGLEIDEDGVAAADLIAQLPGLGRLCGAVRRRRLGGGIGLDLGGRGGDGLGQLRLRFLPLEPEDQGGDQDQAEGGGRQESDQHLPAAGSLPLSPDFSPLGTAGQPFFLTDDGGVVVHGGKLLYHGNHGPPRADRWVSISL